DRVDGEHGRHRRGRGVEPRLQVRVERRRRARGGHHQRAGDDGHREPDPSRDGTGRGHERTVPAGSSGSSGSLATGAAAAAEATAARTSAAKPATVNPSGTESTSTRSEIAFSVRRGRISRYSREVYHACAAARSGNAMRTTEPGQAP